jgi:ppGpp synthetase/RelA/SpoT-type nucleotidyltranferase
MASEIQDPIEEYRASRPVYEDLAAQLQRLLGELLGVRGVDVLAITSRAKEVSSFREKLTRKTYKRPLREVTDLCGVRIVVYLESEIARVEAVVRENFVVHSGDSIDKGKNLKVDQVGYRSLHLVCSLARSRLRLSEYARFAELRFEIQIRTALQHAWAQIEWGRNYKLGGELPGVLKRRLLLASGALEIIDREFAAIADEVQKYVEAIPSGEKARGVALTPLSLRAVVKRWAVKLSGITFSFGHSSHDVPMLIEELRDFGVSTVEELETLLSPEFLQATNSFPAEPPETNEFGVVRDAMMFSNMSTYFSKAHKAHWSAMGWETVRMLSAKYGEPTVKRLLKRHQISVH